MHKMIQNAVYTADPSHSKPVGRHDRKAVRELIAAWMETTTSENTKKTRWLAMRKIAKESGFVDPFELVGRACEFGRMWTQWTVARFRNSWLEKGKSPNTIETYCSNLQSLLNFAHSMNFVAGEGCQPVNWKISFTAIKRKRVRNVKAPPPEQVRERYRIMKNTTTRQKRDRLVVALMMTLGLRVSEVRLLETADWDKERQVLKVMRKGREEKEELFVPKELAADINEYMEALAKIGPAKYMIVRLYGELDKDYGLHVFKPNNLYKLVRKHMQTNPHALRRHAIQTAVNAAAKAGIPLHDVIEFTGHKDVETIKHYWDKHDERYRMIAEMVEKENSTTKHAATD